MNPGRGSKLLNISLRKNREFEDSKSPGEPRYFLVLESPLLRLEPQRVQIPVFWGLNPQGDIIHKETFSCAVFGATIKKSNLPSLIEALREKLNQVSSGASLPVYLLAGAADQVLPVYSSGGKLGASLGSANFQASNIVELWHRFTQYLSSNRKFEGPELVTILTVGRDLNVFPPVAMLFHPNAVALRFPALLETARSSSVFTYVEGQRVEESVSKDKVLENVLVLWQRVSEHLLSRKKITDASELEIAQVSSCIWDTQTCLAATRHSLNYRGTTAGAGSSRTFLTVYQREGQVLAALPTADGTFTLFAASDPHALADCVGKELVRQGLLETCEQLSLDTRRKE